MKRLVRLLFSLMVMLVTAFISLGVVTVLAYNYKWQADKALIGITITYIVAGVVGGFIQSLTSKEIKSISGKMVEAVLLSMIFVSVLIGISTMFFQMSFVISSRFFVILMLMMGSVCWGRVLRQ